MDSKNSDSEIFSETVLKTSGQVRNLICSEDIRETAAAFIPVKIIHHVQAAVRPTVIITTEILMVPISDAYMPGADSRASVLFAKLLVLCARSQKVSFPQAKRVGNPSEKSGKIPDKPE